MRVIASVPSRMDLVLRSASLASRWGSQVGFVQHWIQADWRQSDDDNMLYFQNSREFVCRSKKVLRQVNILVSGRDKRILSHNTMRN